MDGQFIKEYTSVKAAVKELYHGDDCCIRGWEEGLHWAADNGRVFFGYVWKFAHFGGSQPPEEIWKVLSQSRKGRYEISSNGRIRYRNSHGVSVISSVADEYISLNLNSERRKRYRIDRLVAKMFLPNPHNFVFLIHLDGNVFNNAVSNLEWSETGRERKEWPKTSRPIRQYSVDGQLLYEWPSCGLAGRANNIPVSYISSCISGRIGSTGGFLWSEIGGSTPAPRKLVQRKATAVEKQRTIAQYTLDGIFLRQYSCVDDAASVVGCAKSSMSRAANSGSTLKGYIWRWL